MDTYCPLTGLNADSGQHTYRTDYTKAYPHLRQEQPTTHWTRYILPMLPRYRQVLLSHYLPNPRYRFGNRPCLSVYPPPAIPLLPITLPAVYPSPACSSKSSAVTLYKYYICKTFEQKIVTSVFYACINITLGIQVYLEIASLSAAGGIC